MRRALLLAVLAAPAIASAQTPSPGLVLFAEGTSDWVHGPMIGLAECVASRTAPDGAAATVSLRWQLRLLNGYASLPTSSTQVYASTVANVDDVCPTTSSVSPAYVAGPVGPGLEAGSIMDLYPVRIADVLGAAGLADCEAVAGDTPVWICVQAFVGGEIAGVAKGRLTLSISPPGAPTGVVAASGDGALEISWAAPSGNPAAFEYRVVAVADQTDARDPVVHEASEVHALSYRMNGLVNDVPYAIRVHARSLAGNESAPSVAVVATPVAAAWGGPLVERPQGSGQGGCSAGGAGPVALLAVTALLARLRGRASRR